MSHAHDHHGHDHDHGHSHHRRHFRYGHGDPLAAAQRDASGGRLLHETTDAIRWNASPSERYTIRIPHRDLVRAGLPPR